MRLLTSTEVAFLVGIAPKTLEVWYRFKRENPDNEYARMLPEYQQAGANKPRYWKEEDIAKILTFKETIPHGRNGLFGKITHQNTYKKEWRKRKNGKKED